MQVSRSVRRWLLGKGADPSVRSRALREVFDAPARDPRAVAARREIGRTGWVASLLSEQLPGGQWTSPGTTARELYRPKYVSLNWKLLVLAELGAPRAHPGVRRAVRLLLRAYGEDGDLGGRTSEVCVTGNAARMILALGPPEEPALARSLDWLVRHQKEDGGWNCFRSSVGTLDAWEAMAAFAEIPKARRSAAVDRAVERGAEFYLDRGLLREGRTRYAPWERLHYPRHYYYDYLVGLEFLTALGYGNDPRLSGPLRRLEQARRSDGTWALDALHPDLDDPGYTLRYPCYPFALEEPGRPSRWITTAALSVLHRAGRV